MGPVPQPVFKTGEVVQPTAGSVRLRGRSVPRNLLEGSDYAGTCEVEPM